MEQKTLLAKIANRLSSNQKVFFAEIIGTFIVVVLATGSVVIDAKLHGRLGIPFIAFAPFIGVALGVYIFGKISMARLCRNHHQYYQISQSMHVVSYTSE